MPIDTNVTALNLDDYKYGFRDPDNYVFSFGPDTQNLRPLGSGETRYLSTEVAGGFTGVYAAMYATGSGQPCQGPADFDWFDYEPA